MEGAHPAGPVPVVVSFDSIRPKLMAEHDYCGDRRILGLEPGNSWGSLAVVIDASDNSPTPTGCGTSAASSWVVIVANTGRIGAFRQEVSGDRVRRPVGSGGDTPGSGRIRPVDLQADRWLARQR